MDGHPPLRRLATVLNEETGRKWQWSGGDGVLMVLMDGVLYVFFLNVFFFVFVVGKMCAPIVHLVV